VSQCETWAIICSSGLPNLFFYNFKDSDNLRAYKWNQMDPLEGSELQTCNGPIGTPLRGHWPLLRTTATAETRSKLKFKIRSLPELWLSEVLTQQWQNKYFFSMIKTYLYPGCSQTIFWINKSICFLFCCLMSIELEINVQIFLNM